MADDHHGQRMMAEELFKLHEEREAKIDSGEELPKIGATLKEGHIDIMTDEDVQYWIMELNEEDMKYSPVIIDQWNTKLKASLLRQCIKKHELDLKKAAEAARPKIEEEVQTETPKPTPAPAAAPAPAAPAPSASPPPAKRTPSPAQQPKVEQKEDAGCSCVVS